MCWREFLRPEHPDQLGLITRETFIQVCDQVILKPVYTDTESSLNTEKLNVRSNNLERGKQRHSQIKLDICTFVVGNKA